MNRYKIEGNWEFDTLNGYIPDIKKFHTDNKQRDLVIFDFGGLKNIDSSGIILIIRYIFLFGKSKTKVKIENISPRHKRMLELYKENYTQEEDEVSDEQSFAKILEKDRVETRNGINNFLYFIGRLSVIFLSTLKNPSKIRIKETINQIDIAAIQILPIIALALFLVGFVTAYQGADQLSRFGASIIVVEMSTMSMFREIAPFLAAVIIAGRSASSYTAQIGTMKITEEISAMKTMGLDIDRFLLLPRIFALIIVMPLLVFFADMATLLGEMVIVKYHLGIPYTQFIDRIYEYVEIRHIMLGLCKAPLFGILIAVIGCYRGLQVQKGTDIGKYTTKAVVDTIFWLIVVNAMISLLSIQLGF